MISNNFAKHEIISLLLYLKSTENLLNIASHDAHDDTAEY